MFRPTIMRFYADPFRELQSLQRDMNRIFSNMVDSSAVQEYPAINAWSGGDRVIITSELPGIDIEKLDIAVHHDAVTLSGSRELDPLKDGDVYHRQERSHG